MKIKLISIFLCLFSLTGWAQKSETQVIRGNKKYNARQYADAEALYRNGASKDKKNVDAAYNKGNAIYRQYQSAESIGNYQQALKEAKTKADKHKIFHNMGNAFMKQKDYASAVEAYKNALRNNPNDNETRYNFALAKKMQKDNPNQNNKNNQDNKNNKDQNKEQQNKEKEQNKKDPDNDKGNDKKDQDKDKGDNQKDPNKDNGKDPQQQKQDQSKQQMDNMLKALDNHEKQVRERIQARDKQKDGKPVRAGGTKDW